jgi:hypothetical protein
VGAAVLAVVAVVSAVGGTVEAAATDASELCGPRAVVAGEELPRLHGATANAITASSARTLTPT